MTPDKWLLLQMDILNETAPFLYLWLVFLVVGAIIMSVFYTVLSLTRSVMSRWKV